MNLMRAHLLPLLLLPLLLVACAAPKPLITAEEVTTATRNGTLDSLYNQARASLAGKSPQNKKDALLFAQLDNIGRNLAKPLDARLRKQVEVARLNNDIVPLDVLTSVQSASDQMRTWEPSRHAALAQDLARERAITEKAIRDVEIYLGQLPETAYGKHMLALRQMSLLTGDTRHDDKRKAMLAAVQDNFEKARSTDDFETALTLLEELPVHENTAKTRVELQTLLFERRFNESLADDQPDEAYKLFAALAESPYFNDVKASIDRAGNHMANYFIAVGANAVVTGNISDAYRRFSQAGDIQTKLNGKSMMQPEIKPFIDRIQKGHDAAKAENLWGIALGYLHIIQEFDPYNAALARNLLGAEGEVTKRAIRSAAVAPFSSAAGNADYSNAIAGRITENLFQTIPNDVRFIAQTAGSNSVDYIISGSVNEARVEVNESKLRKTVRAVTQRDVVTRNPDYDAWLKLSDRARKRTPQPIAQLTTDKEEDIVYNVVNLRKVGYFSVAFHILEAASGKVIHTDSLTLKRELDAEGNEGVELGQFRLPAKTAALPTDIEILNLLSNEASQEISKRLSARLGELEKRYAAAGKQAGEHGNTIEAAQNYAFAVIIAQRKNMDTTAYRNELKRFTAGTGYAR